MKTVRIALIACVASMFMASLAAQAAEAKAGSTASAPVKTVQVAKPVTITGTVKCYKNAQGVLTGASIVPESGTHLKVATPDLQKVAAFDGQKVSVIGVDKNGALSVEKIEAVKAVEAAK
jgi:hypothetical protein